MVSGGGDLTGGSPILALLPCDPIEHLGKTSSGSAWVGKERVRITGTE